MSIEPSTFGRGLFGYRRGPVDQLFREREARLYQAEGRARASEDALAQKDAELAVLTETNARLLEQIDQLGAELREAAERGAPHQEDPSQQLTSSFLAEELTSLLSTAEESARRIVERARNSTEAQIAEADRMWREIQGQMARFASWRERFEPAAHTATVRIEDVRQRIEDVPNQIRQALEPLADSIASLDVDLREVATVSTPPLLVTPTGMNRYPVVSLTETEETSVVTIPEQEDERQPASGPNIHIWPEHGAPHTDPRQGDSAAGNDG